MQHQTNSRGLHARFTKCKLVRKIFFKKLNTITSDSNLFENLERRTLSVLTIHGRDVTKGGGGGVEGLESLSKLTFKYLPLSITFFLGAAATILPEINQDIMFSL